MAKTLVAQNSGSTLSGSDASNPIVATQSVTVSENPPTLQSTKVDQFFSTALRDAVHHTLHDNSTADNVNLLDDLFTLI